jgi:hypothetical protein
MQLAAFLHRPSLQSRDGGAECGSFGNARNAARSITGVFGTCFLCEYDERIATKDAAFEWVVRCRGLRRSIAKYLTPACWTIRSEIFSAQFTQYESNRDAVPYQSF